MRQTEFERRHGEEWARFEAWLAAREPARGSAEGVAQTISVFGVARVLVRDPSLRHILIGVSVISLGSFGMNTFLPAFFARNYGLGPGSTGLAFGLLSGFASLIGTFLGGYGSEYMARRDARWLVAVPGIGAIIGAPLFVLGLMQASLAAAFPLMLAGSMFFYMAMGPAIACVHGALDSRSRATGSALFLLVMHLDGQGLGPPIAGWVSDAVSATAFGAPDFARVCAGAAGQVPGSTCAIAGATGVRWAIACFGAFYLWSGVHLLWAARLRKL